MPELKIKFFFSFYLPNPKFTIFFFLYFLRKIPYQTSSSLIIPLSSRTPYNNSIIINVVISIIINVQQLSSSITSMSSRQLYFSDISPALLTIIHQHHHPTTITPLTFSMEKNISLHNNNIDQNIHNINFTKFSIFNLYLRFLPLPSIYFSF